MPLTKVGSGVIQDDAVGIANLGATGTASATTFLRGDNAWASAAAGFNSVQVFPATGTWTKPTGVTKILVFITGGGGGGMYRSGDGGHGGGAASTAIKFLDVSSISTVEVTIGAGGVGGSSSDPYNAPAGGASAFGVAPATVHCTAGGGGATSGTGVPGPGGTATGGDVNVVGGGGAYNLGGASFWGNGTNSRYSGAYLSPLANGIYGSGGGGARGAASGSGGAGFCLILEYK